MKKLLTLLGSIGLFVSPVAGMTTSCSKPLTVPSYNKGDGLAQISDNWNFTTLKTVSTFRPENDSSKNARILDEISPLQLDGQIFKLIRGRFDNASQVQLSSIITDKKWTINYYKTNIKLDKFKIEPKDLSAILVSINYNEVKTLYFNVTSSDDTNGSDLMDFKITKNPSVDTIINNTLNPTDTSTPKNNDFNWSKTAFKFSLHKYKDSDLKDDYEKNANSYIDNVISDVNDYSTIALKDSDEILLMKDFFIPSYFVDNNGVQFNNLLNVLKLTKQLRDDINNSFIDKMKSDSGIQLDKVAGIEVHDYIDNN